MTAKEKYQQGDLQGAIAACVEEVKAKPGDIGARAFFAELLCFNGQLERADAQMEAISKLDAAAMTGVAMVRQLARAETARQQFFAMGRVPEFLTKPSAAMEKRLLASVEIREHRFPQAAALLAEAEAARPQLTGTLEGKPFTGLRDLDDVLAGLLEVLTSTGKYYWVPFEEIESVTFHAPDKPRDLIWRPAELSVKQGAEGIVYIPALYPASHKAAADQARLGRVTEWEQPPGGPVTGIGQKTLLIGEDAFPILSISELAITQGAAT